MRMNLLRVGLVSIAVAGLTSCGGEPAQPLTASNAATVLAQLNTVLGQLPRANTAPTLPGNGGLSTAAVRPGTNIAAASDCETVEPTVPVDADADGIALLKTGTFDCQDLASGQYTYTRKGSYTVKDLDDTVAGTIGGLHVDFNLDDFSYTSNTGDKFAGSHHGYWDFKGDGNGGMTSFSEYTGHSGFVGGTVAYETDFDYGYTWEWTHTPDNPAATWTTGAEEFNGSFTMSGKFTKEDKSGNHEQFEGSFKMQYTSKDIRYDSTCTMWYKSGSIFMDDYNGNNLEVRYACTEATLYVNGVKSDWYTYGH